MLKGALVAVAATEPAAKVRLAHFSMALEPKKLLPVLGVVRVSMYQLLLL